MNRISTITSASLTNPAIYRAALVIWMLFAFVFVSLFLIDLNEDYKNIQIPCTGELGYDGDCDFLAISQAEIDVLSSWGISIQVYAIAMLSLAAINLIGYCVLGGLILWSKGRSWIGLTVSLGLVSFPFATFAVSADWAAIHPDLFIPGVSASTLGTIILLFFLYLLPNGRFSPKWAYIPLSFTIFVGIMFIGVEFGLYDVSEPVSILANSMLFVCVLLGAGFQIYRYFGDSNPTERQQTKWIIMSVVCYVLAVVVWTIVFSGVFVFPSGTPVLLIRIFGGILNDGLLLLLPAAITMSIMRYNLWEIDFYINRSLVYGTLTVMLGTVFMGVFFILRIVLDMFIDDSSLGLEIMIPTGVVVGLFNPVRKRVQTFIDRRLYGIKMDYAQVRSTRKGSLTQTHTTTIGNYTTTNMIGSGGMGEVYAGYDTSGNQVAIKVLLTKFEENTEMEKRFMREAHSTAQLEHPNIVKILSVGEDDGRLYLAMEYIEGADWYSMLKGDGGLPIQEVLPRLKELASALDYVHENGIIHRDIKPSNIMIEESTGRAVLMDFGIAKIASEMTALTGTSQIVGSLDYISPEQIQGQENIDYRADIYSFAVMTYQLLTGQLPFERGNAGSLVMAHLMQPPPDAREVNPSISGDMADAIIKGMAKKPQDRFDSVSDFVTELLDSA